jgi:hypothetical protein
MLFRTLTACVSLTFAASAQFPFGHATPVSGFAPSLFAEPLWLGNTAFGYRIQGAPPGGSAFVAVSAGRQDQIISGLQIYPDTGSFVVTHSGPVDATGRATLPYPLNFHDDPALTGIRLYAQAAVTDPASAGSLATTEALLMEITAHPMVAFSAWNGVLWLLDPVTGMTTTVTALPPNAAVHQLVFGNAGRDLFAATSQGVFHVDTFAGTPNAVSLVPGFWPGMAWDRAHRRLYGVSTAGVTVIDGDRASGAFGSVIAQVADTSNLTSVSVPTEGKLLALGSVSAVVTLRDGDPASATYLQPLAIPQPSHPTMFGFVARPVHVSPDARVVTLPVLVFNPGLGLLVHRFDRAVGQWIDHEPANPGYQPLVSFGDPVHPGSDGSALVFASNTALTRVDLDLASPANVTTASIAAPLPLFHRYSSLTPSGRFLLRDGPAADMTQFAFVEVSTGWVTPWVSLPTPTSVAQAMAAAWR